MDTILITLTDAQGEILTPGVNLFIFSLGLKLVWAFTLVVAWYLGMKKGAKLGADAVIEFLERDGINGPRKELR